MSETKLLNCPFCGGEARLQRRAKKHGYYVVCKSCGCRTPYFQYQFDSNEKLREEAITAWNTRKPMERILERLEEENMVLFNAINKYQNNMHEDEGAFDRVRMLQHKKLSNHKAIEIVKEEGGIE